LISTLYIELHRIYRIKCYKKKPDISGLRVHRERLVITDVAMTKIAKNGARSPTKSAIPGLLKKTIGSLSAELLRTELEFLCREYPAVVPALESRLLVSRKEVVRYHADTESEDDANSENESETSASESGSGDNSDSDADGDTKRKPMAKRKEDLTSRIAVCENCKQEFDVTSNERGDCVWHPGT
jgi:hypothetical protein